MSAKSLSTEIMEVIPAINRILRSEMRRQAAPNLSVAHFRTLAKMGKGPQTNKELADWIGIAPSSMCRTVDILVRRGLAKRSGSSRDRREVQLVATAKGKKRIEKVRRATHETLVERLGHMDAETREQLGKSLETLRKVFDI